MAAVNQNMAVVVADPTFSAQVPRAAHFSVFTTRSAGRIDVHQERLGLFVVSTATGLAPVADLVHRASSLHKLRALFVRADVDCSWSLPLLERAGIRALRNTIVHNSPQLPARVLRAWAWGAERELIADAVATDDSLLVRDCALETISVPFALIPTLADLPSRSRFEVDSDGSYLHWPETDTHLSLSELRYATDADYKSKTDLKRAVAHRRFGWAVAELRKKHGLHRTDVTGLSARQIARIESGDVHPRLATISTLAAAHGMPRNEYLDTLADLLQVGPPPA